MSLFTIATLLTTLFQNPLSTTTTIENFRQSLNVYHQPQRLITNDDDLVLELPGLMFQPNFRHYSGFLQTFNDSYLNYWFFESEHDPNNDPVVLWLNGGPGCSSLIGALTENGPFKIQHDLSIGYNQHTWNARVNMLYIESPAQVGFSYKLDQNYTIDDNGTAYSNLEALRSFYRKFPHLIKNDFYITGESYAGIYIPMLAQLIVAKKFPVNLKGFAIGNGLLDGDLNLNSQFIYYYAHGIIDETTWHQLNDACHCSFSNESNVVRHHHHHHPGYCDFVADDSDQCLQIKNQIDAYLNSIDLNLYNINSDCFPISKHPWQRYESSLRINKMILPLPCGLDEHNITRWINQDSVKQALHVPMQIYWSFCNRIDYDRKCSNTKSEIEYLINNGIRALIYNGDLDAVCNFLGVRWFVEKLGLKPQTNYTVWMHQNQIGGFWQKYRHDSHSETALIFATVRGAGHLAITDKPSQTRHLFYDFLNLNL